MPRFALGVAGALLAIVLAFGRRGPENAEIHTGDVERFWTVVDTAPESRLAAALERDYVRAGSHALRRFLRASEVGASGLAGAFREHRAHYDETRRRSRSLTSLEPRIRQLYREMERLHPRATFPDLHFVVGAMGAGGSGSNRYLAVAVEMAGTPGDHLLLTAHELAHAQQPPASEDDGLATRALREGAADWVAERLTGQRILSRSYSYGFAHEVELWEAFRRDLADRSYGRWLGTRAGAGREPAGLGYFLGYRVAEAYWENAGRSPEAFREILRWTRPADYLSRSGYEPGDLGRVLAGARRALRPGGGAPTSPEGPVEEIHSEARVTGPGTGFRTRVVSRADGGARMVQWSPGEPEAFFDAYVGPGEERRRSAEGEREAPPPEVRSFVRGHELHALVVFPETRLYGPVLKEPVAWRSSEGGGEVDGQRPGSRQALAVTWRTGRVDSLTVYYSAEDTLPLGMRVHSTEPEVEVTFDGWTEVASGLRLFTRATFQQGGEIFRYRYDELEVVGPDSPVGEAPS